MIAMTETILTIGARVRLAHDVDRYPHFLAAKGATGTVTQNQHSDPSGVVCVKMDEIIEGAEDWDNEICWSVGDGDDPMRDLDVICAQCGTEIEPHASNLCDSCETQDAYDRASDPTLTLSRDDLRFIAENLDLLAGIDEGENTDYDRLTSTAKRIEQHLAETRA